MGELFSRNTKLKLCQKTPFLQNYGISVKQLLFITFLKYTILRKFQAVKFAVVK